MTGFGQFTDLGLSDTMFGFGAGVFFFAYFLFEVPSNLLLDRFGARRWIARIMFTWGLIAGAEAFVTGKASLYFVRLHQFGCGRKLVFLFRHAIKAAKITIVGQ